MDNNTITSYIAIFTMVIVCVLFIWYVVRNNSTVVGMSPQYIPNIEWNHSVDLSKDEIDKTAIAVINHNEKHKSGLAVDIAKPKVVLHDWIIDGCDFKEQTGLIAVLRGTDLESGNDKEAKNVTKMLRYIILKDADRKTKFMSAKVIDTRSVVNILSSRYIDNPHWVEHVIHAGFIINKKHDCNYARAYWGKTAFEAKQAINRIKERNHYISRYEEIYSRGCL